MGLSFYTLYGKTDPKIGCKMAKNALNKLIFGHNTGCPPTFKMSFPCNLLKNVPFSMLMGLKNIPFSMQFSEKHTFFHANKSSLYVNF